MRVYALNYVTPSHADRILGIRTWELVFWVRNIRDFDRCHDLEEDDKEERDERAAPTEGALETRRLRVWVVLRS